MTADTALRPIDYNTWLVSDPPEYNPPEDDDWFDQQCAAYLPDDEPVY